jgi:hypothetical protein
MTSGTRRGVRGQRHAPAALYPRKDPVPIVQETGLGPPGPVWAGVENLTPTGIRFPDRRARSVSLYRLSYPVQMEVLWRVLNRGTELKYGTGPLKDYCGLDLHTFWLPSRT